MGKIRVKTFDESGESDEKAKKLEARREAKKIAKKADKAEESAVEAQPTTPTETPKAQKQADAPVEETSKAKKKEKFASKGKQLSPRHKENRAKVKSDQTYKVDQAIAELRAFKKAKFDETVELHINVKETGTSGSVKLPHGTGKVRRIVIADDAVIEAVSKGKIEFDILVAEPSMMPKLAKVARVLGPRGLMPNPKNGTISPNPKEAVEKLAGGQITFKTESKTPIIHMSIGKLSFSDDQLKENIKVIFSSIPAGKINNVTLKSTMSPGIRVQIA
jgi:large subunit ribosomal protein L1